MGLQVAAAGKIINEFTGLAFAGGEFETDNPAIRFVSAEAWTANAQGAHITFATAPIGTSSPVEGMRLTSEGILLVGTDTASGSAKLQVSGAISVSGITYAGTLTLSATGANVITLSTNGSERARVTSGGLFGINTNSPQSYLHVNGRGYFTGNGGVPTSGAGVIVSDDGTRGNVFAYNYAGAASRPLVLQEPGGNVLIGTTTDDGSSKLQVAGQIAISNNNGVILQNVGGGAAASLYRDPSDDLVLRNATSNKAIYFRAGGDYNMASLSSAGTFTVYNTTATTGTTSLVVRAGEGQSSGAALLTLNSLASGYALTQHQDNGTAKYTSGKDDLNRWYLYDHTNSRNVFLYTPSTGVYQLNAAGGEVLIAASGGKVGFFGATPVAKQTVTADAASILAALQAYGLAV